MENIINRETRHKCVASGLRIKDGHDLDVEICKIAFTKCLLK